MVREVFRLRIDLVSPVLKRVRNAGQYFFPGRPVECSYWWIVGSPIKRFGIRCKKDVQWPATTSGNSLDSIHIDMIEIWPFLAIDLDINKMLIHERRGRFIFETFSFHYMTP